MHIDVWSDVVCPWCFIGRRRLQKAIARIGAEVTVKHRAFQLQPDLQETVPTKELLVSKYRISEVEVQSMQSNVCSIADGEGLCYDLSETQSGNTRDAHRLLLWAESCGKQDELLELMYSSYFEKKRSLFSHQDLLSLTDACGIKHEEARAILNSDSYQTEFEADIALARQLGITGVPFYAIDMRFGISGAQPDEVFFETLKEAMSKTAL